MTGPMKFRKKPVVIEAMQFDGSEESADELIDWIYPLFDGISAVGDIENAHGWTLYIDTPEGEMECSAGDYIIKGVAGEFYPCKEEIFHLTYEEVE